MRQNRLVKRINFYRNRTNCELKMKGFLFFQKPEKKKSYLSRNRWYFANFLQCSSQNLFTNHGNFPGKCQALGCYILRKTPPEQHVLQLLSAGGIRQLEWLSTENGVETMPVVKSSKFTTNVFFMSLLRGISLQISCNLPPK